MTGKGNGAALKARLESAGKGLSFCSWKTLRKMQIDSPAFHNKGFSCVVWPYLNTE